jgi:hypothetical protein
VSGTVKQSAQSTKINIIQCTALCWVSDGIQSHTGLQVLATSKPTTDYTGKSLNTIHKKQLCEDSEKSTLALDRVGKSKPPVKDWESSLDICPFLFQL